MTAAIAKYLKKWIVDQYRFEREAALDSTITSSRDGIEQVAELRYDLEKIAIHGEDVAPGCCSVAFPERPAHTVGRTAIDEFHPRFAFGQLPRYICRSI